MHRENFFLVKIAKTAFRQQTWAIKWDQLLQKFPETLSKNLMLKTGHTKSWKKRKFITELHQNMNQLRNCWMTSVEVGSAL